MTAPPDPHETFLRDLAEEYEEAAETWRTETPCLDRADHYLDRAHRLTEAANELARLRQKKGP